MRIKIGGESQEIGRRNIMCSTEELCEVGSDVRVQISRRGASADLNMTGKERTAAINGASRNTREIDPRILTNNAASFPITAHSQLELKQGQHDSPVQLLLRTLRGLEDCLGLLRVLDNLYHMSKRAISTVATAWREGKRGMTTAGQPESSSPARSEQCREHTFALIPSSAAPSGTGH